MPTSILPLVPLAADFFSAATAPSIGTRNGHRYIEYTNAVSQDAYWTVVMPLNYGADGITVLIRWMAKSAVVGDAYWDVAIERHDIGGVDLDADSFAASQVVASTAQAASGQISEASIAFTNAQIDGLLAGEEFRIRVRRLGADVLDTIADFTQVTSVFIQQEGTGGGGGGGFFTDGTGTDAAVGKGAVVPLNAGTNSLAHGDDVNIIGVSLQAVAIGDNIDLTTVTNTLAIGINMSLTNRDNCLAIGNGHTISADFGTACGYSHTINGAYAAAFGYTQTVGTYSLGVGFGNTCGKGSLVGGWLVTAGVNNYIVGVGRDITIGTTCNYSQAFGRDITLANGADYTFAAGRYLTISGSAYQFAQGRGITLLANTRYGMAQGATISGRVYNGFLQGYDLNIGTVSYAQKNILIQGHDIDWGLTSASYQCFAQGRDIRGYGYNYMAMVQGRDIHVTGFKYSMAQGYTIRVGTGTYNSQLDVFAQGVSINVGQTANLTQVFAQGRNLVMEGSRTFAQGTHVTVPRDDQKSWGSNRGVASAAQFSKLIKHIQTTNATQTTIATLDLEVDKTYALRAIVTARRTDANGDDASFILTQGTAYRDVAGAAVLAGSPKALTKEIAAGAATYAVDIASSGNNILLRVTGAAVNTVEWCAVLEFVEVLG